LGEAKRYTSAFVKKMYYHCSHLSHHTGSKQSIAKKLKERAKQKETKAKNSKKKKSPPPKSQPNEIPQKHMS